MTETVSDPWRKSKLFNDLLAIWETKYRNKNKIHLISKCTKLVKGFTKKKEKKKPEETLVSFSWYSE